MRSAIRARTSFRVALCACVAALAACADRSRTPVYDGFEAETLSPHWETKRFLPGAVRLQSQVVRAGRRAASITLRAGDQIPQERGTKLERAELQEPRSLWAHEGSSARYSFSLFLPADFPVTETRLVIAQWKLNCPRQACTPDNPVIAVRYQSGELSINKQVSERQEVLYRTGDDIRGRWLDFTFEITFSRSSNGRIRAWIGKNLAFDRQGATAYPRAGGYSGSGRFYFKAGLYRDRMPQPMTIYLDEYRKQPL
jgi:hypothetical protein